MRDRSLLRLTVLILALGLLAQACFLRSVSGQVEVTSIGEKVETVIAAVFANATVAVCTRDTGFEEIDGGCTYIIDGQEVASTFTLLSEFGLFGVLIDPVIVQVPDDVLGVEGTFNYQGAEQPAVVTLTDTFDADADTTVTPEPGQQFAILELPEEAQQAIVDAGEEGSVDFDFSLQVELPELRPLDIKPMFTLRVDTGDRSYYPPMLPCTTDFAQIPSITVPVADDPQNLLDDLGEARALVQPCDDVVYDFGGAPPPDRFARIAGPDRIATAIEVSRATYPAGGQAAAVVLARADAFPDALAGTPFAWAQGGPILLTATNQLDPRVADELQRVIPSDFPVYVLGGTAAISDAVVQQVEALGYTVTRLGGANRFETAASIAEFRLNPTEPVYLADGGTFQAALLAGAAATTTAGRVLLTSDGTQPAATAAWLADHADLPVIAVGDEAVTAAPDATPITGADPYTLSAAVAEHAWGTTPTEVFLASGTVFADGLTGGPLTGPRNPFATYTGGPLLLTDPQQLPVPVAEYLQTIGSTVERAAVFGGTAAISDAVLADAAQRLG